MNLLQQLEQGRADLAALEADTATLEQNVRKQESDLNAIRRAARSGAAAFEAVVEQQGRQEAARGMLAQHLQDLADALALVDELEAAVSAAGLLEEGREARRIMRETEEAHAQQAAQAEAALSAALEDLRALEAQHSQARNRLSTALRRTVRAAHGVDVYGSGDRLTFRPSQERETGIAFLREIDPELNEAAVLGLSSGSGLTYAGLPLLARARGDG